jgi:hypothetical protein
MKLAAASVRVYTATAMSTQTLDFNGWFKQLRTHALDDGFLDLSGSPVGVAAERLGVSPQRVHQLIAADRLDSLVIITGKKRVAVTIVTERSIAALLALHEERAFEGDRRFTARAV